MQTNSRRRFRLRAGWALALLLLAPAFANAQQMGLFPLATIRRERVPCPNEDPVYRLYRQEYYGYHPTCWRRFPPNWGCPSPEAPDAKKAFEELKPQAPQDLEGGDEERRGPAGPGESPLDRGVPGDRGAKPDTSELPPVPRETPSPFDTPAQPGTPPRNNVPLEDPLGPAPASPPRGAARGVSPLGAIPDAAATPTQVARLELDPTPAQPGGVTPILELPEPSPPPTTTATSVPPVPADPAMVPSDPSQGAAPGNTKAPQRRRLIGGFFNSLGVKRR